MQKDLIEPAVNGTKNVLGSVSKYKSTVKRVVLTSSFAGIILLLPSYTTLTGRHRRNIKANPK
jgi:nucleoside-diphosphate-sugar epimerase